MKQIKVVIEKHADGDIAYPVGARGTVVGQGETYEQALHDVQSALKFHAETFGREVMEDDSPVLDAFIAEATL